MTMSLFGQQIPQSSPKGGVHSYFSFGSAVARAQPQNQIFTSARLSPTHQKQFSGASQFSNERKRQKSTLPPVKVEFEGQQKPVEIHVLNDLVKHDTRLNVSSACYSTNPHSRHVLLVYANDAATYEILLQQNSCPTRLACGLNYTLDLATISVDRTDDTHFP